MFVAVRRSSGGRLDGELLDDARLMVSELASNALVHGDGPITLRACLDANRLMVEVVDQGGGFERELRQRDFQQVGGWGLTSSMSVPAGGACTKAARTCGLRSSFLGHGSAKRPSQRDVPRGTTPSDAGAVLTSGSMRVGRRAVVWWRQLDRRGDRRDSLPRHLEAFMPPGSSADADPANGSIGRQQQQNVTAGPEGEQTLSGRCPR